MIVTKLQVAPVELVVPSESICVLFDNVDTAKMHELDKSNVSSHVESSQVEFGLKRSFRWRLMYKKFLISICSLFLIFSHDFIIYIDF